MSQPKKVRADPVRGTGGRKTQKAPVRPTRRGEASQQKSSHTGNKAASSTRQTPSSTRPTPSARSTSSARPTPTARPSPSAKQNQRIGPAEPKPPLYSVSSSISDTVVDEDTRPNENCLSNREINVSENIIAEPTSTSVRIDKCTTCAKNKEMKYYVNLLLRELSGVLGSEETETIVKHCKTSAQDFQYARDSIIRILSSHNSTVDKTQRIPTLVKQVAYLVNKQHHDNDAMRSAHGKHLVHCQQINVDKIESEYREKFSKQDEEKKKLIIEKFSLQEEIGQLKEELKDTNSIFRNEKKEMIEEKKNLEKSVRQISQDLSQKHRELNRKSQEWEEQSDEYQTQISELEIKVEDLAKEKRKTDQDNENIREQLRLHINNEVELNQQLEETQQQYDGLTREMEKVQNDKDGMKKTITRLQSLLDAMVNEKNSKKTVPVSDIDNESVKGSVREENEVLRKPLSGSNSQTPELREIESIDGYPTNKSVHNTNSSDQPHNVVSDCLQTVRNEDTCKDPDGETEVIETKTLLDFTINKKKPKSALKKISAKKSITKTRHNITKSDISDNDSGSEEETQKKVVKFNIDSDSLSSSTMSYTMRGKYEQTWERRPTTASGMDRSRDPKGNYLINKYITDTPWETGASNSLRSLMSSRESLRAHTPSTRAHTPGSEASGSTDAQSVAMEANNTVVCKNYYKIYNCSGVNLSYE